MSRICREKLCFVEQENYLVIQLFLVTTIEVSSVSLLKDFYDGIDNKKKRKKKQNKCICLLVAHINFFSFPSHSSFEHRSKLEYVRVC